MGPYDISLWLKKTLDQTNHQAIWLGAQTTLETLMDAWTDDNEFNRELVRDCTSRR